MSLENLARVSDSHKVDGNVQENIEKKEDKLKALAITCLVISVLFLFIGLGLVVFAMISPSLPVLATGIAFLVSSSILGIVLSSILIQQLSKFRGLQKQFFVDEKTIGDSKAMLEDLETKLAILVGEIADLEERKSVLLKGLDDLEVENECCQLRIQELETQINLLKEEAEGLSNLSLQRQQLQSEIEIFREEIEALKSQRDLNREKLECEIEAFEKEIKGLEEKEQKVRQLVERELESLNRRKEEAFSEMEKEVSEGIAQGKILSEKLRKTENCLESASNQLALLSEKISLKEKKLKCLDIQINEKESLVRRTMLVPSLNKEKELKEEKQRLDLQKVLQANQEVKLKEQEKAMCAEKEALIEKQRQLALKEQELNEKEDKIRAMEEQLAMRTRRVRFALPLEDLPEEEDPQE